MFPLPRVVRKVQFQTQPSAPVRRNLHKQQETKQETSPPPSVSPPWFLGGVLWRKSRLTLRPNVCS